MIGNVKEKEIIDLLSEQGEKKKCINAKQLTWLGGEMAEDSMARSLMGEEWHALER